MGEVYRIVPMSVLENALESLIDLRGEWRWKAGEPRARWLREWEDLEETISLLKSFIEDPSESEPPSDIDGGTGLPWEIYDDCIYDFRDRAREGVVKVPIAMRRDEFQCDVCGKTGDGWAFFDCEWEWGGIAICGECLGNMIKMLERPKTCPDCYGTGAHFEGCRRMEKCQISKDL